MFVRFTTFPLASGSRPQVEPIADKFGRILAEQRGYRSITFCFDDEENMLVAISLWESRAFALAATANVRDPAQQALGELLRGTPTTKIMEVYGA
jgi:heme-degrading monooxygenase HmoA